MKNKNFFIFTFCIIILIIAFLIIKNNNTSLVVSSKVSLESGSISGENTIIDFSQSQPNDEFNYTNSIIKKYDSIKAVYSSGWVAGGESTRKEMIKNITDYGFNAVVLDIKDEAGHISYASNVPVAIEIGASRNMIKDIKDVLEDYHENGIYVIGRIVTFKDPIYAKSIKEIAFQTAEGTYWTDNNGNYWPNPYNKDGWNYPLSLAKEAAELGFDEVQFDYVRFPSSEGRVKLISYGFDSDEISKSQIINQFLSRAMDELSDYKVNVSADVFGITTKRDGDFENIGQDYKAIAGIVDVICPMVYPSHYGRGEYGVARPDLDPYTIIYKSMKDATIRVSGESKTAVPRPYLQDFTASWLGRGNYQTYENEAVRNQIKACFDVGISSFTLWDPYNKYCYEALSLASESLSGESNA